ncbi:MAG: DNA-protecting protein DprA [Oligoflexales bacterium]|nr:DNA-protecting protein DprA [Oligoflexales bacterium]
MNQVDNQIMLENLLIKPASSDQDIATYLVMNNAHLLPQDFFLSGSEISNQFPTIFFKGNSELLRRTCVSVVGTRNPTQEGAARARRVTAVLNELGVVVVSGLAKGIDTIAHKTALEQNGSTVAVLGTPIHKIYPAENKTLAMEIENKGLLLSPSLPHEEKGQFLFPRRNRLMALLSMATIIVEAGETSGVVHQAAECLKQGRKLFLLKSLVDNKALTWPAKFIKSGAQVVESPEELKGLLAQY